MALISEEVCGNCVHHKYDSDGTIWCDNSKSPDHFEDVKWDHSCDLWEQWENPENE